MEKVAAKRMMDHMKTRIIALVTAIPILGTTISLYAVGVRIPNQDAEANARGNAFVATANNPSAIYYNPAGITQLKGHNLQGGILNYFGVNFDYDSPSGRRSETEFEVIPIPQLYYVFAPEDHPLSYGLGLYAPFGLGIEWPEDTGFRTLAIEAHLTFITLNPVVAYKPLPNLSIAAGLTFNYSKLEFRQGLGLLPKDEFRYEGEDFGYGFNLGFLWEATPQIFVGGNYRSKTEINYRGKSEMRPFASPTGSQVDADFPQIASGGISFRPNANWNIEVAADWTDWSSFDSLVVEDGNTLAGGTDVTLPLKWHGSWFYHFGLTRYYPKGYFVSMGYFFSENSTSERHFTPYVPDGDIHVGSIGAGYKGERWYWAIAGQIMVSGWRKVDDYQTTSLIGETANGKYRFFSPTLTVSLGHRF